MCTWMTKLQLNFIKDDHLNVVVEKISGWTTPVERRNLEPTDWNKKSKYK